MVTPMKRIAVACGPLVALTLFCQPAAAALKAGAAAVDITPERLPTVINGSLGALGTDPDPTYPDFLIKRLVEVIAQATRRLEPARVGFAVANATSLVGVRHWVLRPDKIQLDPFGNPTTRANMHVAKIPGDATGPAGPADPDLSLVALQSTSGRPIALLANLGMHYHGVDPIKGQQQVSADYFGLFAERLQARIAPGKPDGDSAPFVAIMSQGTSGDVWHRDYANG